MQARVLKFEKIFSFCKTVDFSIYILYNEIKINNELEKLINIAMLCNDTKVGKDNELAGDPTETALIDMGMKMDVDVHKILSTARLAELPFDSDRKLMTTVHEVNGKYVVYTKGAIDELLKRCDNYILDSEIKNKINDERKTEIIEPAVNHLKTNIFSPDLKAEKLHLLCGISNTYFRELFMLRFKTSPKEYITSKMEWLSLVIIVLIIIIKMV